MKTAVIVQARMTSSRLPGKILKPVLEKPLLDHMMDRLSRMQTIDDIIIATTDKPTDDPVEQLTMRRGYTCFRGSEEDVLDRVLKAARQHKVDLIVETTGDCPLIDPVESDKVVRLYREGSLDYASNVLTRTYPRGMDTQVFPTSILEDVNRRTHDPIDHEHVSYFIYQHPELYRLGNVAAPRKLRRPDLRLTVDTMEDFQLIENIIEALWPENPEFSLEDIVDYLNENPTLLELNKHVEQKKISYG